MSGKLSIGCIVRSRTASLGCLLAVLLSLSPAAIAQNAELLQKTRSREAGCDGK